ncbi:hypothetical protein [Treponema sp.]|uniref:hypothetical protein n=1 Tax=Treponema sp. TaxID=166 RepID=UPI00388E3EEF
MVLIYLLWFLGVIFSILMLTEIAVIIYRLVKKNGKVKGNIICAVVFVILSIACSSLAVFLFIEKISDSNISLSEVTRDFSRKSAEIGANAYKGFKEGIKETLDSENNN